MTMNETPKFTPGPWGVYHDTCSECRKQGVAEYVIEGPPSGNHGQFSHEPDARLIAAAPDLLTAGAALNALIETAQRRITEYLTNYDAIKGSALADIIGILDGPAQRDAQGLWRAAREKAGGSTPAEPVKDGPSSCAWSDQFDTEGR